jgi:hypothetical protein
MKPPFIFYSLVLIFVTVFLWKVNKDFDKGKTASYYFEGMITKSGEMFDRNAYTAAVPTEDEMYHWYRVEWKGRVVYVYANDLMGKQNYRTSDKRHIDLSEAAFGRLAPLEAGVLKDVRITKAQ